MKGLGCAVCFLLFPQAVFAQAGVPKTPGVELVAHFVDGSVMRRVRLADSIDVQTRYGKLSIPVQDVRRIEFATRLPDETAKQIERAIEHLGSRAFAQRESASRDLAALGARAHPAVKKAAASMDKEVSRRAKEVLAQIEQSVPAEQFRSRPHDVIHTADSVLTGQVLAASLKAKTSTFGDTQLAVAELQVLHLETQTRALALEGTSFAGGERHWTDSGIVLDAGSDVRIQATGEMDLCAKSQPGHYSGGPDGCDKAGRYADNTLPGMLMGRIGEQGTPFPIGSNSQLKAIAGSGKLYLCVVPVSAAGEQMSGNYQVRVTAGLGVAVGQPPAAPPPPVGVTPSVTGAAAPLPPLPAPELQAPPAGGVPVPRASY